MNKQELKIAFADGNDPSVTSWLSEYFEVEVVATDDIKYGVDLIIFLGGADIDPDLYGEPEGRYTYINEARDRREEKVFFYNENTPKLGICRGSQLLTALNGGKLVQHVEGHSGNHKITDKNDNEVVITSTHHQMMYPFEMARDEYDLIAWSTEHRSNCYLNGYNKEIPIRADFVEPEIVYYPKTNSLAIQGHPEYGHCPDSTREYCVQLIRQYLLSNKLANA